MFSNILSLLDSKLFNTLEEILEGAVIVVFMSGYFDYLDIFLIIFIGDFFCGLVIDAYGIISSLRFRY